MEPEDLLDNIRAGAMGKMTLNDKLTAMLARALNEGNKPKSASEAGLTDQEEKILQLISTSFNLLDFSQFLTLAIWGGTLIVVTAVSRLRSHFR